MQIKVLVEPEFEYKFNYLRYFSGGLVPVYKKRKHGFVDCYGNIVVPFIYDNANPFSEGLAIVVREDKVSKFGKHGFIDRTGKAIIPLEHGLTWPFSNGKARGESDYLESYVLDKDGTVTTFDIRLVGNFCEGLFAAGITGESGYVDENENIVIPCIYDSAYNFCEGLALVEKDEKYGFINKQGDVVVPLIYDDGKSFSEGLAAVQLNGRYGYIDEHGNIVIPFEFESRFDFHEGRAKYFIRNKTGADKEGSGFRYGYPRLPRFF